jgi:hypothetical protein
MSKNKFYYVFKEGTYVDTVIGIKALAKFLDRSIESVYSSMSSYRKKNKKEYVLKSYTGEKYIIQDQVQFFGKKNIK